MQGRDLADMSSESADIGLDCFDTGEEVWVGEHRRGGSYVLDVLAAVGRRWWNGVRAGGRLAVVRVGLGVVARLVLDRWRCLESGLWVLVWLAAAISECRVRKTAHAHVR